MRLWRPALVLLVVAAVAAHPAVAKEGVKATLSTSIPLDAPPGTRLDVAWTLGYVEDGRRRPFGAGGVFVRLVSASGGKAETAFAGEDRGYFTATVTVPEGGIGDVEIGLVGWQSGANGTRRADHLFPITNDPLLGAVRVESPTSSSPTWVYVLVAALISMLVVLALARRRAKPRGASEAPAASP